MPNGTERQNHSRHDETNYMHSYITNDNMFVVTQI